MEKSKISNKMDGAAAPPSTAQGAKSKLTQFKVVKAYPGHKEGEVITHSATSNAAINNVANGYWEKL